MIDKLNIRQILVKEFLVAMIKNNVVDTKDAKLNAARFLADEVLADRDFVPYALAHQTPSGEKVSYVVDDKLATKAIRRTYYNREG